MASRLRLTDADGDTIFLRSFDGTSGEMVAVTFVGGNGMMPGASVLLTLKQVRKLRKALRRAERERNRELSEAQDA